MGLAMKGWELEGKPKFHEFLRDDRSIKPSEFISCEPIKPAAEKKHISSEGDQSSPKESFKNRYRGYAFQCDMPF